MVKVLAQAGTSLADVYDVEGSIAGVDELDSREVSLVHEMGGAIMSERVGGRITRSDTGALLQTINWDLVTVVTHPGPFRVLGVTVIADVIARVLRAQVSMRQSSTGREVPLFLWDSTLGDEVSYRTVENGAAVANMVALVPLPGLQTPSMGFGTQQREVVNEVAFRGTTVTFGAGDVTVTMLMLIAAVDPDASISSYGLPLPGW